MKQHPKRETRLARLSRTCSLILSFLILWFASFHTVLLDNCLLKTKKETAARGENEGGRRASSDRRVRGVKTRPGWSVSSADLSKFWSAIFTQEIRESPQFLRRNRIGILPVAQCISADQKGRWLGTVACSPSPQNRAVQTHFFDSSFWFQIV